jgi:hypothetical protein
MTSSIRLHQAAVGLFFLGVFSLCSQAASAALIAIEPDSYAAGTDLTAVQPGVALGVYNTTLGDLEPSAISVVESVVDTHTSTGTRVFGINGFASFTNFRQLNMTFSALTDFASIDFIGSSAVGDEFGVLEAYDSLGALLESYTTAGLGLDEVETMSFHRISPDVKFARAYTSASGLPFGRLDNLSFEEYAVIPEPAAVCLVGIAVCGLAVRRRPQH